MTNRPLQITTTTHALAYVIYAELFLFGTLAALGLTQMNTFSTLPGTNVPLGIVLMVGGAGGVMAIIDAQRKPNPIPAMKLEFSMVLALAAANGFFLMLLFITYGFGPAAASTSVYAGGTAVGCLARAGQILWDVRKYRKARANPLPSTPTLAEPTEPTDDDAS